MSYVKATLGDNEKVVGTAGFHWSYSLYVVLVFVTGVGIGGFMTLAFPDFFYPGIALAAVTVLYCAVLMIKKWCTEIVVTNHRLVYKRGWLFRKTEEISVGRLEEINLEQSLLGRLLDYGVIRAGGTGIGEIQLPSIDSPVEFRKAIQNAQSR
jgi:uncharacterized membrane protein YdbT with pleckstrin-like domain